MSNQELITNDGRGIAGFEAVDNLDTSPGSITTLSQKIRLQILAEMTDNGKFLPSDTKDLRSLLQEMDNSALLSRKLDIEEKSGNDAKDAVEAAKRLREIFGGGGRTVFKGVDAPLAEQRLREISDSELPVVTYVQGERDQGEQPLNADDFLRDV